MTESNPILEVRNLRKYFKTPKGMLHAVEDVSFSIEKGKTLGLVGESGCGKSTTGRAILRLIEPTSGEVYFEGRDVLKLNAEQMRKQRKQMQIIFQDPFSSLDPRKSVGQIIGEPIRRYNMAASGAEKREMVLELMETVGLASRLMDSYPHELDGGRRQRVGIARALAVSPELIICDEPISALDVSIQAQIVNLMSQLQKELGLTYLFIAHDLAMVRYISNRVAVMNMGSIVELNDADELYSNPQHEYTRKLLAAIPEPYPE